MTTSITNTHLAISTHSAPFSDTYCKGVRVFGEFLGRSLYALGLAIASLTCRIFDASRSQYYASLARYQFTRGDNALETYLKFGHDVIDFSYNGCVHVEQDFHTLYDKSAIEQWSRIGTDAIPLQREKLKSVERGCCLGMSLDFIAQYLQRMRAGMPPLEAVREISSRYTEGAPEEAQLAQIFYHALDVSALSVAYNAQLNAYIQERKQESLQWLEKEQERILRLPYQNISEQLAKLQITVKDRLDKLPAQCLSQKILGWAKLEAQRDEIIAQQFGLHLGNPRIYAYEEKPVERNVDFDRFLDQLPDGCYAVGFRAEESAHALSLIKSKDRFFLFEPNFATLAIENIAEKLWSIGKAFYSKNGVFSLSFSPCALC